MTSGVGWGGRSERTYLKVSKYPSNISDRPPAVRMENFPYLAVPWYSESRDSLAKEAEVDGSEALLFDCLKKYTYLNI
jgi:hypothetical protein